MAAINNKYDFTLFIDATDCNPNGDPDNDNCPRQDPETGKGLITPECIKRQVRDCITVMHPNDPKYKMYIATENGSLNRADYNVLVEKTDLLEEKDAKKIKDDDYKAKDFLEKLNTKNTAELGPKLKSAACAYYYDVRAFGAVMTSFASVGSSQIRGPIQIRMGKSIDEITPQQITVTRCMYTTEKEAREKKGSGTMGHRYIVPYGLYRIDGHISASLAQQYSGEFDSGLSEEDLEVFWEALMNMFEFSRSNSRSGMVSRKLIIFKHDSVRGNAPADKLFKLVKAEKQPGVEVPREYEDYNITIDEGNLPAGVHIEVRE